MSSDLDPFNSHVPTIISFDLLETMAATKALYIVGAKRTPFGGFGGKLKKFSATDLSVHASQAALAHAGKFRRLTTALYCCCLVSFRVVH